MVWAAFSTEGKLTFAFPKKDIVDISTYLCGHLLNQGEKIGSCENILQQNNASIHSAKDTKKWLDHCRICGAQRF